MEEKEIQHKVTQQDLDNNPELGQSGVQVGEVIGIPAEDTNAPGEGEPVVETPAEQTAPAADEGQE